jgi:dTDP-4-dehydrorhamnose reductase
MKKDKKILIIGARGMLGQALRHPSTKLRMTLAQGDRQITAWDKEEIDITNEAEALKKIKELGPELIINCAAYNAVDKAEDEIDVARKLNSEAVGYLAKAAREIGAILVHYSTGYVFDGKKSGYKEDDLPNPLSAYAITKALGEEELIKNTDKYYLIRTNLLFGSPVRSILAKKSFIEIMLQKAKEIDTIEVVNDEFSNPTYVKDLAEATFRLIEEKYSFGIYHLVNEDVASWYDWAKEIFEIKNIKINLIPISADKLKRPARRPKYSVLLNTKFPKLRNWQEALSEYLNK